MKKKTNNKDYTIAHSINDNLGLDADGSSGEYNSNLDSDNDRISGNPDGEDDQHNTSELPGHSALEDK